MGEVSLMRGLKEYLVHFHQERNHKVACYVAVHRELKSEPPESLRSALVHESSALKKPLFRYADGDLWITMLGKLPYRVFS